MVNINILDVKEGRQPVPYRIEDLGLLIQHCSGYPKRWAWFWPQFLTCTPEGVLENSLIVYHDRAGKGLPDRLRSIMSEVRVLKLEESSRGIVQSTLLGIQELKTRLIVRIHDDVGFRRSDWVEVALKRFNQEPHLRILAEAAAPAGDFGDFDLGKHEWIDRFLRFGEYENMSFAQGSFLAANRVVWVGYYPLVAKHTEHYSEDKLFTLFAQADGTLVDHFGGFFRHRGIGRKDEVKLDGWSNPCEE